MKKLALGEVDGAVALDLAVRHARGRSSLPPKGCIVADPGQTCIVLAGSNDGRHVCHEPGHPLGMEWSKNTDTSAKTLQLRKYISDHAVPAHLGV